MVVSGAAAARRQRVTESGERKPRERDGLPRRPPWADAGPGSELLASARTSFLVDQPVRPGIVREPILASWTRSRIWRVPTDHIDLPYDSELDHDTVLTRAAGTVLDDVADQFATEP